MPFVLDSRVMALVTQAQVALGLSQHQLGVRFGVSRRTIQRWTRGGHGLTVAQLHAFAHDVHRVDPSLAARIAVESGTTLEDLGLVPRPAPPAPPPSPPVRTFPPAAIVDSVVCAAADSLGVSPAPMRRALRAALERARDLGLGADEILAALTDATTAKKKRAG